MISGEDIRKVFRGKISINEPVSRYTSVRIGGPADIFLEPADRDDAVAVVKYFQGRNTPFIVIGKGSNVLVSDEGIRGAVLHLEPGLSTVEHEGGTVSAGAGISMARFVDFCIQNSFGGVEMLAGIPGTIGGAIAMNAGAYGGETSDHLVDVTVVRGGELQKVEKRSAGFGYRSSGFGDAVIIGGRFRLEQGDKAELVRKRRELLLKRNRSQPVNIPNSGSMFMNPDGTYAAKLIEEAGLKGKKVGGARISELHANFIVNEGTAKAADVIALLKMARSAVQKKSGILMSLEIKLVGFPDTVRQEFMELSS